MLTHLFGCLVISVEAVDVDSGRPPSDVLWPTPELLEEEIIFKGSAPSAFVMIPSSLIQLRGLSSGTIGLCSIIVPSVLDIF